MCAWIRERAAITGLQPRQVQAAIWTGVKKAEGRAGDTTAPFEELIKGLDMAKELR